MENDNRFRVTVYSQQGYFHLCDLKQELISNGIEAGITGGGLAVWGEWDRYEGFAAIANKYDCWWESGGSKHYAAIVEAHKRGGYPEELAAKRLED